MKRIGWFGVAVGFLLLSGSAYFAVILPSVSPEAIQSSVQARTDQPRVAASGRDHIQDGSHVAIEWLALWPCQCRQHVSFARRARDN